MLKKRVENLRSGKSANADSKDAFYTPEKEAEEIEGLLPEIEEKIADTRDMQVRQSPYSQHDLESLGKSRCH